MQEKRGKRGGGVALPFGGGEVGKDLDDCADDLRRPSDGALKQAVAEETGEPTTIYSGPLHDAAEMAKLVPSIMMFVMSEKGLSHCKPENTPDDALETAVRASLRLSDKVVAG